MLRAARAAGEEAACLRVNLVERVARLLQLDDLVVPLEQPELAQRLLRVRPPLLLVCRLCLLCAELPFRAEVRRGTRR